jgi:DNA-binding NarL/FixJ family response regulator
VLSTLYPKESFMSLHQSAEPIKVFVISAQRLIRDALCLLLNNEADCTVIGHAACAKETLTALTVQQPDILLADLDLPDGINAELVEQLSHHHITIPLVVLTLRARPTVIRQLLQLDIQACLTKDIDKDELIRTLKLLKNGGGAANIVKNNCAEFNYCSARCILGGTIEQT